MNLVNSQDFGGGGIREEAWKNGLLHIDYT
jgi:hypothetical protein